MTVKITTNNDTTTIYIDDLFFNVEVSRRFIKYFMDNIAKGVKNIELDLSRVLLLDSIGVGILVQAQTMCYQDNVNFYITNVNEEIMELIKQVRLDKILTIKSVIVNFDKNL